MCKSVEMLHMSNWLWYLMTRLITQNANRLAVVYITWLLCDVLSVSIMFVHNIFYIIYNLCFTLVIG